MSPAPQPNYFRRRSKRGGEFVEVGIGGHDDERIAMSEVPDLTIRTCQEIKLDEVRRPGIQLSEAADKLTRKILVQQQLHRATRRPIRAANSYTARKSSVSSSG